MKFRKTINRSLNLNKRRTNFFIVLSFRKKSVFFVVEEAKYLLSEIRMLDVERASEGWRRSVRHGDDFDWSFCESGGTGGQFAGLMVALHPLPH